MWSDLRVWWHDLAKSARWRILMAPLGCLLVALYLAVEGLYVVAAVSLAFGLGWPVVFWLCFARRPPDRN